MEKGWHQDTFGMIERMRAIISADARRYLQAEPDLPMKPFLKLRHAARTILIEIISFGREIWLIKCHI